VFSFAYIFFLLSAGKFIGCSQTDLRRNAGERLGKGWGKAGEGQGV